MAAFCTISNPPRPLTNKLAESGKRFASSAQPITLSTALWRPISSRNTNSSPAASKSAAACKPPVRPTRFAPRALSPARRKGIPRKFERPYWGRAASRMDRVDRYLAQTPQLHWPRCSPYASRDKLRAAVQPHESGCLNGEAHLEKQSALGFRRCLP